MWGGLDGGLIWVYGVGWSRFVRVCLAWVDLGCGLWPGYVWRHGGMETTALRHEDNANGVLIGVYWFSNLMDLISFDRGLLVFWFNGFDLMAFGGWWLVVGVWQDGGDWFLWLVVVASWVWVVASCYLLVAYGQWMASSGWRFKERDRGTEIESWGRRERKTWIRICYIILIGNIY